MDRDHKRKARDHFIRRVKERFGIKLKAKQYLNILNQVKAGKLELAFESRDGRKAYYYKLNNLLCRIIFDESLDEMITIFSPGQERIKASERKRNKNV